MREVIAFVKDSGGLDYAVLKMKDFQNQALKLIQHYPNYQRFSERLLSDG